MSRRANPRRHTNGKPEHIAERQRHIERKAQRRRSRARMLADKKRRVA